MGVDQYSRAAERDPACRVNDPPSTEFITSTYMGWSICFCEALELLDLGEYPAVKRLVTRRVLKYIDMKRGHAVEQRLSIFEQAWQARQDELNQLEAKADEEDEKRWAQENAKNFKRQMRTLVRGITWVS